MDSAVLERMAKIMSYMRVTAGKPGKKPKRKDKLAALHGIEHSQGTNFPVVHGTENILPKPAGTIPFKKSFPTVRQLQSTYVYMSGWLSCSRLCFQSFLLQDQPFTQLSDIQHLLLCTYKACHGSGRLVCSLPCCIAFRQ